MNKLSRWLIDTFKDVTLNRRTGWLGHNWAVFMGAVVLTWPLDTFFHKNMYFKVGVTIFVAFALVAWFFGIAHDYRLCERCIENMPLDGTAVALKKKRTLKNTHRLMEMRWGLGSYVMLVLAFLPNLFSRKWAFVLDFPCGLGYLYILYGIRMHRRLHPWCPWCHWGDGGEHEEVPDPVVPHTV